MAGYRVLPYSIATLVQLFSEKSTASPEVISLKAHKQYFDGYFSHLNATTIVVEEEYIDHDYLEDFSAYYVKCFSPYKRLTSRLHFFCTPFDEVIFRALLNNEGERLTKDALQEHYLGFIVVKPLPQTIVGRTCLRTYRDADRRCFPITQTYGANLFGIPLKVDTLAFQEQDSVVAACATSALWSCFHGTGKLFHHFIPSPVEITKSASVSIPSLDTPMDVRTLPNHGLTATQMAYAVKHIGLEPFIVGAKNKYILNSTIYAYAQCKIPTILGISLQNINLQSNGTSGPPISMGRHAVAVTGFSLGLPKPEPEHSSGLLLRASRIDKLYVHDDQIGPFAKMSHLASSLSTSWGGSGHVEAIPELMILPLYHKIRIPFSLIHDTVLSFDKILEVLRQAVSSPVERFEWDIYLTTVNTFKEDIFENLQGRTDFAEQILTSSMPKYMWRATVYSGDEPQVDFLFDATGIEQQELCNAVCEYSSLVGDLVRPIAENIKSGKITREQIGTFHVLELFNKFL